MYCSFLSCTTLSCSILTCPALSCTALYSNALLCIMPPCLAPPCSALLCPVCPALSYPVLSYQPFIYWWLHMSSTSLSRVTDIKIPDTTHVPTVSPTATHSYLHSSSKPLLLAYLHLSLLSYLHSSNHASPLIPSLPLLTISPFLSATDSGPLSPGISALDPAQKGLRGTYVRAALHCPAAHRCQSHSVSYFTIFTIYQSALLRTHSQTEPH